MAGAWGHLRQAACVAVLLACFVATLHATSPPAGSAAAGNATVCGHRWGEDGTVRSTFWLLDSLYWFLDGLPNQTSAVAEVVLYAADCPKGPRG
jgi:hypothetical protein